MAAKAWWDGTAIHQIYVRSFQDSNGDGIGDLPGVTQRLGYLQDLGVRAIWLTPFFPSPNADFGYDVSDCCGVAPEYGTLADWDALIAEAQQRGIRVLVDLVLNHTSSAHPWFQEACSSRHSAKRDWYVWRNGKAIGQPDGSPPTNWRSVFGGPAWTRDEASGQWCYHAFLPEQPDLNWHRPAVREAMWAVARFWLQRGASGFRLDATAFLFEDPAYADDPTPQAADTSPLRPHNAGRPENHAVLRELRAVLPQRTPVFFFSNHDHWRQWSAFGDGVHNDAIARLTAALTLAQRGTALIYCGEEIGMGDLPDDELAAAPLGPKRPRADFRHGAHVPLDSGAPDVLAFGRRLPTGEGALVLLNWSAQARTVHVSGWPSGRFTQGATLLAHPAVSKDQLLPPYGARLVRVH
jgi:alpha-glucosidase